MKKMKKMKNNIKTTLALLLSLLMAFTALGCSLVSVNKEKDDAQVVAKVGEHEILKSDYMDEFNYMYQMYSSFGMDPAASELEFNNFKEGILDQLISSEMTYYQAVKQGYLEKLSKEQKAEIEEQVAYYDTEVYTLAKSETDALLADDPSLDFNTVITEQYRLASASYFGKEMSQVEVQEFVRDFFTRDAVNTKLQEDFNASITVSDEEVQAAFDEQLQSDKSSFESTPSAYKDRQEAFERVGGIGPLCSPAGYKRMKMIQIIPESELSEEYTAKLAQMTALESELGPLTLKGEEENAQRITEIKEEYAKLKEETDKLSEQHYAKSKADADAAYQKLQSGVSFETVMKEYNMEEDFKNYEIFQQKGKLMYTDTEVADWPEPVKKAALALTVTGSYTPIVQDDTGFYILQYVGDEPVTEHKLADFQTEIHEKALSDKQSEEWNILLEEWIADESIVTRYPEVLATIQ